MKKRIAIVSSICVLFLLGAFLVYNRVNNYRPVVTEYVAAQLAVDPNNLEEFVGFYDYVCVGKVEKEIGNLPPVPGRSGVPYTEYQVKVLKNIKGSLADDIIVKKAGGYVDNKIVFYETLDKKDAFLSVGDVYIFCMLTQENGDLFIDNPYAYEKLDAGDIKALNESKKVKKYEEAYKNEKVYERERFKSKYEKE
ncbi:MAG: hypothetical protein PWR01_1058 [Clostridiales bacterium]|nr:hypothetical protein [Clostridiales bacterium]